MENAHPMVPIRLLNLAPDGLNVYKGTKQGEASGIDESGFVLVPEVQEDLHDKILNRRMCQRPRDSFCGKQWNLQQKTLPMNKVSSF